MRRLCFIVPTLQTTRKIVKELEHEGVLDSRVHVLGKNPDRLDNAHLNKATVFQTTDLVPALKRGMILSVVLIGIIFAIFYSTMPSDVKLGAMAIGAIVLFGFFFGTWASAMIGIGIPNQVVDAAKDEVQSGHYLLMVDIPAERQDELTKKVLKKHPKVHLAHPVE